MNFGTEQGRAIGKLEGGGLSVQVGGHSHWSNPGQDNRKRANTLEKYTLAGCWFRDAMT